MSIQESQVQEERRFHLFYSSVPSIQYIMGKGRAIQFVAGRYHTDDAEEIAELKSLPKDRGIYQKAGAETATETDMDPMKALEKRFREQFMAELAAKQAPADTTSAQGKLNVQSTTDIAAVTIGGPANTVAAAALAKLATK